MNTEASAADNEQNILDAIANVQSGEVTYAVRDTMSGEKEIKEGEVIGISGKEILANGKNTTDVALEMISQIAGEDSEIITLFYGEDVKSEEAEELLGKVEEQYPDADVELYDGGQPLYYYFISAE